MNSLSTIKPNTSTSIWKTKFAADDEEWRAFEYIRKSGRDAVLLETGVTGRGWFGGKSLIGIVNPKVKVPMGEDGLFFIRDFIRRNSYSTAGFMGFVSYDLGEKWIGIRKSKVKSLRQKRIRLWRKRSKVIPEAYFVCVDEVIEVKSGRARAFCNSAFSNVGARCARYLGSRAGAPRSNLTKEQYFQKIAAIRAYLYAGETYQVNFSQRFSVPYSGDAFELYKMISAINPSPFQFFMETPEFAVISNSPERLFNMEGDTLIETRPIKGTVPVGKTFEENAIQIQKLLASEKDRAELAMIVDLSRNDLGKICVPGTVEVTEERTIEKYSHVIHTAANIRGILEKQRDWYDALRALFPGGSVTGCPKKRTMEIIRELEEQSRGIYCGSAGVIDSSGQCDFNIMIRTMWLDKKNQILTFRSGGGIVVDSDPEKEYEETLHKAAALISAIG